MEERDRTELERTEMAVLGCALKAPTQVAMIGAMLPDEHAFHYEPARGLWAAMREIAQSARGPEAINPATVYAAAKAQGNLDLFAPERGASGSEEEVYAFYFEADAADPPIEPEGLAAACRVIQHRWVATRLHQQCLAFASRCRRADVEPLALLQELKGALGDLEQGTFSTDERITPLDQAVRERLAVYDEVRISKKPVMGVSTGYELVDRATGGLFNGTLTILGGWFKDGKSSFSCFLALQAALQRDLPVGVFSYEMSAGMIADRYFTQWFGVSNNALRWGTADRIGGEREWGFEISYEGWARALREQDPHALPGRYVERLGNFRVVRASGMTVPDIEGTVRSMDYRLTQQGRPKLALVVVDYLQLVLGSRGSRQQSRAEEVSKIGRDLHDMSITLDRPVLALSQLTRDGDTKESKDLMGHCDSFWIIRRVIPGQPNGMLYMPLNRTSESGIGYRMLWKGQTLTYHLVDQIHNADQYLAEARKAQQHDPEGGQQWYNKERQGDRPDRERPSNGRSGRREVSLDDEAYKAIFPSGEGDLPG